MLKQSPAPVSLGVTRIHARLEAPRIRAAQARVASPEWVRACIDAAYPGQTPPARIAAAARDCGVHGETVRRWAKGVTRPLLADFWPVLHRTLARSLGPEAIAAFEAAINRPGQ